MLPASAVNWELEPRSDQTKDYEIGIRYFSTKQAASKRKSKDWFAQNQEYVNKGNNKITELRTE